MNEKIPYYMAYPLQLPFDDDRIDQLDMEYLKSMYPETAKKVLPYVEEECDRMEYENSMIYDQYPDKLQLKLMSRRICDKIRKYEDLPACEMKNSRKCCQEKEEIWHKGRGSLFDLVEVLLFQELHRRRCDHRRMSRRFY